jgi:structural maintenance of chromosomes protein 5
MASRSSGSGAEEKRFRRGTIVRVAMKNFLTYDEVVIHPGPGLNIVMGPNGSGKSTILCAIALALGGTIRESDSGCKIHACRIRTD